VDLRFLCVNQSINQSTNTWHTLMRKSLNGCELCTHPAHVFHSSIRYLNQNQLSGTIPSSIGSLVDLRFLCVNQSINQFTNTWHTLMRKRLNGCELCTHPAPIFHSSIRYLNQNQLSGTIPSSIGSLQSLYRLCVPRSISFISSYSQPQMSRSWCLPITC